MRDYTADKYYELVENTEDEKLQAFMVNELAFLNGINNAAMRTIVDLGAGYGRVIPKLSSISGSVIAIEINPNMFERLKKTADHYPNVNAVQGDFLKLSDLMPNSTQEPAFLILQNSLGTIENGGATDTLEVVMEEIRKRGGSLVLSLFKKSALNSWGLEMYEGLRDMVGAIDEGKTDVDKGLFATSTGYSSKWWTDNEILGIEALGRLLRKHETDEYVLMEVESKHKGIDKNDMAC